MVKDVASLSWWITSHVREGRDALNFSEWGSGRNGEADDAAETVAEGSMPPDYYTPGSSSSSCPTGTSSNGRP